MEGSPSNNFDAASIIPNVTPWTLLTVTPLLSSRKGLIYFNRNCKDGLFNLAKKIVSVLHEEVERKMEKLNYKKLEGIQPRIKSKSELPAGE